MTSHQSAHLFRWKDVPRETVTDQIDRKLVTGERAMIAHVYLTKGAVVPRHAHENEQFTYVLSGALRLWVGPDGDEVYDVRAGELLHIPSNVPHQAQALEDTDDLDVFCPPRQDWLDGTDTYFHRKAPEARARHPRGPTTETCEGFRPPGDGPPGIRAP